MANALYDTGRNGFLTKKIDWLNDNIKVALVSSTYTPDLANHTYLSDVTGIVATSSNLTTKTASAGVAGADNVTIGPIATGSTVVGFVIYQDTGVAGTSLLIAHEDVTSTPTNGGTISLTWDTGANKIFKL